MENAIFFETIIQPKGNVHLIFLIATIVILLLLIVLICGMIYATKNTNISISGNEIVINSFMYGRKIPVENVLMNEIQVINLNENKEFAVSHKTNGINMPNFTSGWMQLNNGKKALVFITNKENILFIPTNDFIVLFSMKNASEFVKKLQEIKQ